MLIQDLFGTAQELQTFPFPQTNFLTGTFFATSYSKVALEYLHSFIHQKQDNISEEIIFVYRRDKLELQFMTQYLLQHLSLNTYVKVAHWKNGFIKKTLLYSKFELYFTFYLLKNYSSQFFSNWKSAISQCLGTELSPL